MYCAYRKKSVNFWNLKLAYRLVIDYYRRKFKLLILFQLLFYKVCPQAVDSATKVLVNFTVAAIDF